MSKVRSALCATLIALIVMQSAPAMAWSEGGHHIIALMAFRLLSKEEQTKLMGILEHHPRFAQDFTPPNGLPNEGEIQNWRIGRAGYWPDVARSQPEFHRSTWHYELGAALVIGDPLKVRSPERPGQLPSDATLKTQELYISQALELCKKTLADKSNSDTDRALALCWIAHLVADAHQPCHAGSLYMEKVFVESDGDRGANRILLKQRGNMHALWDQLLGDKFTLNGTNKRIAEITADEKLVAEAKQSIETAQALDPQTWLAESRESAIENVYTPEVLDSLHLVSRGIAEKPEPLELTETYLKNAGRVAQSRAIQAAYRLAETWRLMLK